MSKGPCLTCGGTRRAVERQVYQETRGALVEHHALQVRLSLPYGRGSYAGRAGWHARGAL
ncbi:hypothetical protein BDY19DRAFT_977842 [Irpex rosettiformis]|uniref:Uncharacterized protein n=2 Tax=Irpex rosettiformis TaxID=378272 RepID=A0ACB8TNA7_9APHY|nr:hypothetical protein BDY19DRAFT_978067 [Irpex rosettiformis]KAI0083509.1 hypothetical protein BDY19DRAFT_977842 [Irpex rosettiformis]